MPSSTSPCCPSNSWGPASTSPGTKGSFEFTESGLRYYCTHGELPKKAKGHGGHGVANEDTLLDNSNTDSQPLENSSLSSLRRRKPEPNATSSKSETTPAAAADHPQNETADLAIVMFTDVYGLDSGRHQKVCDDLVQTLSQDYGITSHAFCPDLFHGTPICQGGTGITGVRAFRAIVSFLGMIAQLWCKYKWDSQLKDDINDMLMHVASKMNPSDATDATDATDARKQVPIVLVGFCFGGWLVAKASGEGPFFGTNGHVPYKIIGGMGGHPSWEIEHYFHGGSMERMASAIQCPQLLLPAGDDSRKLRPEGCVMKILKEEQKCENWELSRSVLFEEMKHGWITRGDSTDEDVRKAQSLAMEEFANFSHAVFEAWRG